MPASTDAVVGPQLQPKDQFGWALSGYRDVDRNGIREILVGAPGDDEVGDADSYCPIIINPTLTVHGIIFLLVLYRLRCCLSALSSSQEVPSCSLRRGPIRFAREHPQLLGYPSYRRRYRLLHVEVSPPARPHREYRDEVWA